jgi:UDP-N-acetylmuramoyl-L-alanine---L-glutamate ligase
MLDQIIHTLKGKRLLILGFGREGKSSLQFLQKHLSDCTIGIADHKAESISTDFISANPQIIFHMGANYLESLEGYDLVLKSPGVSLQGIAANKIVLSSQTELFLKAFAKQTVGITGTKGKSTTASLIHHLLQKLGVKSLLTGNIGIPCFDIIQQVEVDTIIVFELSANQLEYLEVSPHIAILLNLFEEHLDYFGSFDAYKKAKFNIARYGKQEDLFICNKEMYKKLDFKPNQQLLEINEIDDSIPFKLKGKHNRMNAGAALSTLEALGISRSDAIPHLTSFNGLPHRTEYLGCFEGVEYYNDSIATVPEATIAALETLQQVDFLILGGFDRGIDYSILANYLDDHPVKHLLLTGKAGARIASLLQEKEPSNHHYFSDFKEIFKIIQANSEKGSICLLSPAAASYDQYMNFEHRGDRFRQAIAEKHQA